MTDIKQQELITQYLFAVTKAEQDAALAALINKTPSTVTLTIAKELSDDFDTMEQHYHWKCMAVSVALFFLALLAFALVMAAVIATIILTIAINIAASAINPIFGHFMTAACCALFLAANMGLIYWKHTESFAAFKTAAMDAIISFCYPEPVSIAHKAAKLIATNTITSLDLTTWNLSSKGLAELLTAVQATPKLTELKINKPRSNESAITVLHEQPTEEQEQKIRDTQCAFIFPAKPPFRVAYYSEIERSDILLDASNLSKPLDVRQYPDIDSVRKNISAIISELGGSIRKTAHDLTLDIKEAIEVNKAKSVKPTIVETVYTTLAV